MARNLASVLDILSPRYALSSEQRADHRRMGRALKRIRKRAGVLAARNAQVDTQLRIFQLDDQNSIGINLTGPVQTNAGSISIAAISLASKSREGSSHSVQVSGTCNGVYESQSYLYPPEDGVLDVPPLVKEVVAIIGARLTGPGLDNITMQSPDSLAS